MHSNTAVLFYITFQHSSIFNDKTWQKDQRSVDEYFQHLTLTDCGALRPTLTVMKCFALINTKVETPMSGFLEYRQTGVGNITSVSVGRGTSTPPAWLTLNLAVNDNEETLTLSGGLVSPALWPSRIWSCTELWSSSGLPAGPLPRAGSARSPGHPIHQKTTDNKHDTKAAISSAKIKLTTNNKSKAVSVLSS